MAVVHEVPDYEEALGRGILGENPVGTSFLAQVLSFSKKEPDILLFLSCGNIVNNLLS